MKIIITDSANIDIWNAIEVPETESIPFIDMIIVHT